MTQVRYVEAWTTIPSFPGCLNTWWTYLIIYSDTYISDTYLFIRALEQRELWTSKAYLISLHSHKDIWFYCVPSTCLFRRQSIRPIRLYDLVFSSVMRQTFRIYFLFPVAFNLKWYRSWRYEITKRSRTKTPTLYLTTFHIMEIIW